MNLAYVDRLSDSPFVQSVTHGYTVGNGSTIRPAEIHWHMIFTRYEDKVYSLMTGPLTASGVVDFIAGAEILWIKFKLGTFMPHLPTKQHINSTTTLPEGAFKSFWLNGSTWELPNYENVETFIDRLARQEVLIHDPVVQGALEGEEQDIAARTLRYRFVRSTGLTQKHIQQYHRAQEAATLLKQGVPILDAVYEMGYFDQPHLTRSLKQFVGYTPAQLSALSRSCVDVDAETA